MASRTEPPTLPTRSESWLGDSGCVQPIVELANGGDIDAAETRVPDGGDPQDVVPGTGPLGQLQRVHQCCGRFLCLALNRVGSTLVPEHGRAPRCMARRQIPIGPAQQVHR